MGRLAIQIRIILIKCSNTLGGGQKKKKKIKISVFLGGEFWPLGDLKQVSSQEFSVEKMCQIVHFLTENF
jgi:hypothetical protein